MTQPLILAFPMPNTPELQNAYTDLFLAANGDENTKKRIGDPALLPRPWDPPTCTKPALRRELWTWLDMFVTWFNHDYIWDHTAGMIPPCWPQHPHLIHDIAVLADQRRRAALDPTSTSLEDWHRSTIPAFLDRLKTRTKTGCDEHHSVWPAQARHNRATAQTSAAERAQHYKNDVATVTAAQPESRSADRPRLQLIDADTHRPLDPVTGEVI